MTRPKKNKEPRVKQYRIRQPYKPPEWAERYIRAALDWEIKPTISARCESIGIDRGTFYHQMGDPRFVEWFEAAMCRAVESEQREVRSALLRNCVKGDLEAIKLWHQLYGHYIPTERRIVDGDLASLSDRQLMELAKGLAAGDPEGTSQKVN